MENILWKRGIIIGIILLFVGAGVTPSISGNIRNTNELHSRDQFLVSEQNSDFDETVTGVNLEGQSNDRLILENLKIQENNDTKNHPILEDYLTDMDEVFYKHDDQQEKERTQTQRDADWWPMFHHDPEHSGYSSSTGPTTNNLRWSYEVLGDIYSSPAVVDNMVIFRSDWGYLYWLNMSTGDKIRQKTLDYGPLGRSSPAISNGNIYIGDDNGQLVCIGLNNGSTVWKTEPTPDCILSSPTVFGKKVYIGLRELYNGNNLFCYNASTGVNIWNISIDGEIQSSSAVFDDKLYVGTYEYNGKLYCIDARNGSNIWTFEAGSSIRSSPTIADGKVYFGTQNHVLYCLDKDTGDEIWNFTSGDTIYSTPAVAYGNVYVGSYDDFIYCLDAENGSEIWSYQTGYASESSPAIADGKVYFGTYGSSFFCLDAFTGYEIWNFTASDDFYSSPAIVDGNVYVGCLNGFLYCFGPDTNDIPPNANFIWSPECQLEDEIVNFDASSSYDADGTITLYEWDWESDGIYDDASAIASINHTFSNYGYYLVTLRVTDDDGLHDIVTKNVRIIGIPNSFSIETIDSGNVAFCSGVDVDSNDYPHIVYSEGWAPRKLYYTYKDASGWHSEIIDPDNTDLHWGTWCDIVVNDYNDHKYISYTSYKDQSPNSYLKDAVWKGSDWVISIDDDGQEIYGENIGLYNKISISSNNCPYPSIGIAYVDYDLGQVRFSSGEGSWPELVYESSYGSTGVKWTSVANAGQDICFRERTGAGTTAIKYATFNGNWVVSTIDPNGGDYTSIDVDPNNRPHVSYEGINHLHHAYWNGSGWEIESVDGAGGASVPRHTSIDVDDYGRIHISYRGTEGLKYALYTGSKWIIQTIDILDSTLHTSINVDSNGQPHITYHDYVNNDIKYAKGSPTGNDIPEVDITYPTDDQMVDGTVLITGTADDSDGTVTRVEVMIGEGDWEVATGTTSWSYSWDTTTEDNGGISLYARSYDGISYSTVDSVLVVVYNIGNQPPTVDITYPQNGETVNETIIISGTASDTDGTVTEVQVKIDGGGYQTASGTNSWSYSWDTTTTPNGAHTIYARSYDGEDYSTVDSINVNVDNEGGDVELDFYWTPLNPVVGEKVTFYATCINCDRGIWEDVCEWFIDTGKNILHFVGDVVECYFEAKGAFGVALMLYTVKKASYRITVGDYDRWCLFATPISTDPDFPNTEKVTEDIIDTLCLRGWDRNSIRVLKGSDCDGDTFLYDYIDGWLGSNVKSDDRVLIWIMAHGHCFDMGPFGWWAWLQFQPTLFNLLGAVGYDDIDSHLENLDTDNITVVSNACHSGASIWSEAGSHLKDNGRVILNACLPNETALDNDFSEIVKFGFLEWGDYPCYGGNLDGVVSSEEAGNFSKDEYQSDLYFSHYHPVDDDYYPSISNNQDEMSMTSFTYNYGYPDQHQPFGSATTLDVGGDIWYAQSFVPEYDYLTRLKLQFRPETDLIGPLEISIRREDPDPNNGPSNEPVDILTTIQIMDDSIPDPNANLYSLYRYNIDIIFDSPVYLDKEVNEKFFIVCHAPDGGTGKYLWKAHLDPNGETDYYTNGEVWKSYGGINWAKYATGYIIADLCFITYGKNTNEQIVTTGEGNTNDRTNEAVFIDSTISEATFSIRWSDGDLNLTLKQPDSSIVNPIVAESDPNVMYINTSSFELYKIANPMAGEWTLIINDANGTSGGKTYTTEVTALSDLSITMIPDKDQYNKGEAIKVEGRIFNKTDPMIGASVVAFIERSDGNDSIFLYDDGNHDDRLADDGIYANYYNDSFVRGIYNITVEAEGSRNGIIFARESIEKQIYIAFKVPSINLKEPYVGYINEPIEFNASDGYDPDGTIISYEWDFGDDTNGAGVNPTHVYSDMGIYNVTLVVTDDDGLNNTFWTTAFVDVPYAEFIKPKIYDILSGNYSIEWISYNASGSNGLQISLYLSSDLGGNWSQIDGLLENTGNYILDTTEYPEGYYILKIESSDSQGYVGVGYTSLISIAQPPSKPTGPSNGFTNIDYSFQTNKTDLNNDQIYYQWNWDDGKVSDWIGPYDSSENCIASYNWSNSGIFNVRVRAKNASWNFTSDWSDNLTINIENGTRPEITNVMLTTSDPLDTEPGIGWENFTCTVIDNVAVDEVKLVLTGITTNEYPMVKDGDNYYSNITLSTADEYTYHIWASDLIGNNGTSTPQPFNLPMNEDVNEDGSVGFVDIMMVAGMWNVEGPNGWHRADVDNNGEVGFVDVMMVAGMWGQEW